MALSQSFLQNRARILGQSQTESPPASPVQSNLPRSFQEARQQVLATPKQASKPKSEPKSSLKKAPPVPKEAASSARLRNQRQQSKEPKNIFDIAGSVLQSVIKKSAEELKARFSPQSLITPSVLGPTGRVILTPEQNKKINDFVVEFAKDVLRAVPRAGASVALTVKGEKELIPGTGIGPAGKAEKILFGEKPVRDIRGTGEEIIQTFGGSPETAAKYGLPLGAALTALDLFPGLSKKKVAETIAKETNPLKIKDLLKTKVFKDIGDDTADAIAKRFALIDDAKEIQKEIDRFAYRYKEATKKVSSGVSQAGSLLPETKKKGTPTKILESDLARPPTKTQPLAQTELKKVSKMQTRVESAPSALSQSKTGGQGLQIVEPPLQKVYKETPEIARAIEQTAKTVKEPTNIVGRVFSAMHQVKTRVIEYAQNEHERIRLLTTKKGLKVDDISDPYLKATLYPGRKAEKINQGKKEAEEIVKGAKKLADEFKTDLSKIRKEVNDYLYFRHVPERNLALGEKAAGITTKEARAGLKALEGSPRGAKIKELADRAIKLNEQTLDLLKKSGVISDELYTTLRAKYKNHVPLNRIFEETEDIGSVLSGRGFDVRSTGIRRAVGSEREVDDILTNIVNNYEQAVLRSEKNIVDQATLAFVRNNKDILQNTFEIIKPRAVGKTFGGQIIREKTNDPRILQMFENGKPVWIKINDPHLAVALRDIGREKLGTLMNAVGTFTRLYSGLATRFNPEFALPNKIRDLQETAVYLASQKGVGFKGAAGMVKRDVFQQNTKAILDYLRGADSEGARLYKELKELGGTTGGFGLSTRQKVELDLKNLEKLANSKTRRIADNLIQYVDRWNTIFEDSTRLSVYRQALKQGLSKERAAFLAKEASINFNRMGKGGPVINALWMFSNASIQGSTKMIRSLRNPKVAGATVLTVFSSVVVANEWNDRVDPDWRNKVTKWDRLNGLPIVIPNLNGEGIKYFTIPVSWGIKPIKVMTEYAYDAVSGRDFNVKNFMNDAVTSMLEAYNPVGGTDLISALTPTILDTQVDIARNRAWHGGKIKPDFDPNAPADIQYFRSQRETKTGQIAISISELLQSKTGIALSPASIKYAFEGYIGGAGKAVSRTVNTITGLFTQKPAPMDEYPMVSRFYRERTQEEVGAGTGGAREEIKKILQEQSRERFKAKQKAEDLYEELSKLPPDEANKRGKEIFDEDPDLFEKLKDIRDDKALGLNYNERLIKQLGVENGERAKYIWQRANKLKTDDEKNAFIKNLVDKKVITDEVFNQLVWLKENR